MPNLLIVVFALASATTDPTGGEVKGYWPALNTALAIVLLGMQVYKMRADDNSRAKKRREDAADRKRAERTRKRLLQEARAAKQSAKAVAGDVARVERKTDVQTRIIAETGKAAAEVAKATGVEVDGASNRLDELLRTYDDVGTGMHAGTNGTGAAEPGGDGAGGPGTLGPPPGGGVLEDTGRGPPHGP